MEDDDDGRESRRRTCGRHCEQARRLMRVSTVPIPENAFESGDKDNRPRNYPLREELLSTKKKKDKVKNPEDSESCDDEYMLQNLHKLKRFVRRVWNYAWCYTQFCYPGLRTTEYYKKVKRACQEKEKSKKKEKKDKKKDDKKKDRKKDDKKKLEHKNSQAEPLLLSTGAASGSLLSDNSTQTDESEWSDLDGSDDDDAPEGRRPKAKPLKHLVKPFKILPSLEEELSWSQYMVKRFREVSQWVSNFIDEADRDYQIGAVVKVICLLLAPAVMWLGINYVFLKRKYKSLSGKLRRIKEENEILKKESGKLENMLQSTEKLKMPFSSKESRQQVVAEFTRLAESRLRSKKEITRLTTEKQALMEELRMAKKQRDAARSQYSSLTQGILETNNSSYVQS